MVQIGRHKKKRFSWEPVVADTAALISLMKHFKEMPILDITFNLCGTNHIAGMSSDYNKQEDSFYNSLYFLDQQEFSTFSMFCEKAEIDGQLLTGIENLIDIMEVNEKNPRNYLVLNEFTKSSIEN